MRVAKIKLLPVILAAVLVSGVLAGCSSGSSGGQGGLRAFEYNYGSFFGGEWDFKIVPEGEGDEVRYLFIARGYNGVDMDVEKYVDRGVMDELAEIISSSGVFSWDGFEKRDGNILDGYGFSLMAEYGDGSAIVASGYEKYPKKYDEGHAALSSYLMSLAG